MSAPVWRSRTVRSCVYEAVSANGRSSSLRTSSFWRANSVQNEGVTDDASGTNAAVVSLISSDVGGAEGRVVSERSERKRRHARTARSSRRRVGEGCAAA